MQTISLSFYRFARPLDRAWALAMMAAARRPLARTPGLGFHKLCGSGSGEGFTPVPNTGVYAILGVWQDLATAQRQTAAAPVFARYRARATECWQLFLRPLAVRGRWSGTVPFTAVADAGDGPLAALTRASVRLRDARRFWRHEPAISRAIGADPNVRFKIGIGELPLLHQVTVSVWPDAASMAAFARADGPHARAIAAVRAGDWFAEELYARFRVVGHAGRWHGRDPLAPPVLRVAA